MFPRNKKTKLIIKFFVFFIIFSSIFFYTSAVPVRAAGITEISVSDIKTELEQKYNTVKEEYLFNKDWWQDKVWSSLKNEVLNQVLQQVAYDTATYLGSGGEGGKAWWRKENMETYMRNVADDAAGTFIENMAQKSGFLEDFDICEPDMDLKMRIGLGLVEEERPEPTCNFTEMKDNWEEEL